jgi:hypothetical protein
MYRAVGAGPGDTKTYLVDLPLPWGRDTEVTLPMQALVDDAWTAMEPAMNASIDRGVALVAASVMLAVGLGALWIKKGR